MTTGPGKLVNNSDSDSDVKHVSFYMYDCHMKAKRRSDQGLQCLLTRISIKIKIKTRAGVYKTLCPQQFAPNSK